MSEPFIGRHTIYGVDGEHATPYMTRYWIGRLRLHIFHRGDADPDCHDHPWDFWTFPLVSYVEEYLHTVPEGKTEHWCNKVYRAGERYVRKNSVEALKWHYRPASFAHRVLHSTYLRTPTGSVEFFGRFIPEVHQEWSRKIVTIVWRGKGGREWGFWKHRDGKWCWSHWRSYIFHGGKNQPCGDAES